MKNSSPGQPLSQQEFDLLLQRVQATCLGVAAVCDASGHIIFGSRTIENITGKPCSGSFPFEFIHPADAQAFKNIFSEQGASLATVNIRMQQQQGGYRWLNGTVTKVALQDKPLYFVLHLQDITEQKEAEEKLEKAKRLYFFLSQINQMLVKTADETTLFQQACDIAVDIGRFRMAWIGLLDPATLQLEPAAHAGNESGYLSHINISAAADKPEGRGPSGKALRQGEYIVCNDIANAPEMMPWKDAALQRHYCSSISLPIKRLGNVIGTYSLYADTAGFFDTAEIDLLEECAGDISFALDTIEKDRQRRKTEQALSESEKRYQTLTEISPVGIFHTDATGYTTYVNPRWCIISGMVQDAALGNGWYNAVHPEDRELLGKGWDKAVNDHVQSFSEYRFLRPDGSISWVMGMAVPERNAAGEIIGYVGTITDITARILAEQEMLKEKNMSDALINALPGIFYLSSPEKGLMRWNKNLERICGYTFAELKGKHQLDFIDLDQRGMVAEKIKAVIEKGEAGVQANLYLKNGQKVPYYFTGIFIHYDGTDCVAGVGIDFTERVDAQEKIKSTTQQLRKLAAHLQHIREEERIRIGREIHDELGQQLTAIKMDAVWLEKKLPAEAEQFRAKTQNILTMLEASHQSVRRILNELKPGALDEKDLAAAVLWLGRQFTSTTEIPVEFSNSTNNIKIPEAVTTSLFRVYQEALTNIMRYAEASTVNTSLVVNESNIILRIQDNGKGFEISSARSKGSFGILGMEERAIALGGSFLLETAPGKGTAITVTVPLETALSDPA
ncbi:MAG: PAS domain S-box protein [Ferruginibacter sp.]